MALPPTPNMEQLKKRAKTLLKASRSRDAQAAARFREHLPRCAGATDDGVFITPPTLAEAQLVIAREHGFPSWPRLKRHVETTSPDVAHAQEEFKRAVRTGDTPAVKRLLLRHPALRLQINEPWFSFDSPAIIQAAGHQNQEMVDLLLSYGADINAASRWWAGGFRVLPVEDPDFAAFLIDRGATVDVHAAAGMDHMDRLVELVEENPALVYVPGGDGQRPLHFARTERVAAYLLDHGAEIDARDLDHGSTAAQYMAADRTELCRYLVSRGASVDIFMAVQLGDLGLVRRRLEAKPDSVHARAGQGDLTSGSSNGGHIYEYTLANNRSPLQLAATLGHWDVYDLLAPYCSPAEQLLSCCLAADKARVQSLLAAHPGIVQELGAGEMRAIADAAWAGQLEAVRLMLDIGFDKEARGDCDSTALNRAAVRGFVDLIDLLLTHGASLDAANEFGGTALSSAQWGAENFGDPRGDYPAAIQRMLDAGASLADVHLPCADRAVNAVLRRHLEKLSPTNIIAAIKLGRKDRVNRLLTQDPGLLTQPTGGLLPLHQAVRSGQQELVALLLQHGADPDQRPEDGGRTAREEAEQSDDPTITAFFQQTAT